MSEKIAIIRIRGKVRVNKDIIDTLDMLRLYRQNYCAVYEKTPSIIGMIQKIKDYVAWGEIDDETFKILKDKRGKPNPKKKEEVKPYFRLNPPRGGFERKGIKKGFNAGGALGYRGKKIIELINRMI